MQMCIYVYRERDMPIYIGLGAPPSSLKTIVRHLGSSEVGGGL